MVDEVGGVDEADHPGGAVHEIESCNFLRITLYVVGLTGCRQ
jgi:hypothetical protein